MDMEFTKAPGGSWVKGQPAEAYFADPGIGRTDLMNCAQSPAKFKAGLDAKARGKEWRGENATEEDTEA